MTFIFYLNIAEKLIWIISDGNCFILHNDTRPTRTRQKQKKYLMTNVWFPEIYFILCYKVISNLYAYTAELCSKNVIEWKFPKRKYIYQWWLRNTYATEKQISTIDGRVRENGGLWPFHRRIERLSKTDWTEKSDRKRWDFRNLSSFKFHHSME